MFTSGTAYESSDRSFSASVSVYTGSSYVALDSSKVASFDISENIYGNNAITMGTANSTTLELSLVELSSSDVAKLYKNVRLKVSLTVSANSYTSRTDELGVFYIDSIEFEEYHINDYKSAKITAYDGFAKTEKKFSFTPVGTSTPKISTIISSIATSCGVSYDSSAWSSTIEVPEIPEDVTCRQMISYLAGLQGTVAFFNRSGALSAKWYSTCTKVISREEQYENGVVLNRSSDGTSSGDKVIIKYLESGTAGSTVIYDNAGNVGESISFENPLITDASQLAPIFNSKIKSGSTYLIQFTPLSVKWKGNATIETGEIVQVKDRNNNNLTCYIMERTLSYDGGLIEEYKCCGENETTVSFSNNFTMQKINRQLSALEEEIKSATDVISQTQGSIFEFVRDPNDPTKNSGWKLYNSTNDNYILATSNGIGFSSNGGQSFVTGIYIDPQTGGGHIYGQVIVAGSITTDKISFSQPTSGFTSAVDNEVQSAINSGGITIGNGTITGMSDDLATILTNLDTDVGTANTNASNAVSTANAASNLATNVNSTVASWAYGTGTTYIDGSKIYSGTITAEQLNLGWQAGNLASSSKWTNPGYDDSDYLKMSVDDNGILECIVAQSFTSSTKKIYSAPFYMANGAKVKMSATFSLSGASGRACEIALQKSSTIDGTYTDVSATSYISANTPSREFTVSASQYYRLALECRNLDTNSEITNIYVTYTVTGTMVVNGIIKSNDGKTYFDLDSGEICSRSDYYRARINNGAFETYTRSTSGDSETYTMRGLVMCPSWTDTSGAHYECGLYYQQGNATYATLGMRDTSGNFYPALQASYNSGNSYARVYANFGGFETVNTNGDRGKMGIGSVTYNSTSYTSAAIQVRNSTDTSNIARLDAININSSSGAIKCSGSPWLVLGSSSLSYNGSTVITTGNISSNLPSSVLTTSSSIPTSQLSGDITNKSYVSFTDTTFGATNAFTAVLPDSGSNQYRIHIGFGTDSTNNKRPRIEFKHGTVGKMLYMKTDGHLYWGTGATTDVQVG